MNNLAMILLLRKQPADADSLLREALATSQRTSSRDHPRSLIIQTTLAQAVHDLGRIDESVTLYRDAIDRMHRVFGANHPRTTATTERLSALLESAGRRDEAAAIRGPYPATAPATPQK
jgi:hypothetical protein